MGQGIDSSNPLTAEQVKVMVAAGKTFFARYLVPESLAWKRLTAAEAKAISEGGGKIVSVYETTANRAKGGAAAGKSDGIAALAQAKLINQPIGSAIYFAVDYDAQAYEFETIEAYLRAANNEIKGYQCGVYGSFAVIEEMHNRKACTHFWQTYAWSARRKSNHANIFQYQNGVKVAGVPCDLNESFNDEGWWSYLDEVKPKPVELGFDKAAAQKVINDLGTLYLASDNHGVMNAAHFAADALRKAAGLS